MLLQSPSLLKYKPHTAHVHIHVLHAELLSLMSAKIVWKDSTDNSSGIKHHSLGLLLRCPTGKGESFPAGTASSQHTNKGRIQTDTREAKCSGLQLVPGRLTGAGGSDVVRTIVKAPLSSQASSDFTNNDIFLEKG